MPRLLLRSFMMAVLFAGAHIHAAPNIILILTDDLGYGDVYCLHQKFRDNGDGGGIAGDGIINGSEEAFIYTPNIDRMAAEGAKLTRHYTSAPVCAPARGSLLGGRDQGHSNIRNNSFDKAIEDNHTLGTVLQEAGYYTACVGKWGVGGSIPTAEGRPNSRGFDYFYGYYRHVHGHQHYPGNGGTVVEQTTSITTGLDNAYTTDLWTAKTKQIIQDRTASNPSTPFFIYLAYDAPHAQLQVPTQAYPAGSGTTGGLTWPLNTNSGSNDTYIHPDYSGLGNSAARHATMVRRIDDSIGDILQTLRDLNIDDNTLVIFTSDNGTHAEAGIGGGVSHDPRNFDSYGVFEGIKRDTWEGGIRMPTFAWWPTQIGDNNPATDGLNSIRPSAFWDWMPTLADAAGLTPPAWSSGVSLLPELTATGTQLDKGYLYFEYQVDQSTPNYSDFPVHGGTPRGEMQAIFLDDTDGTRYKGIRYSTTDHSDDFLIYDVDADPGEVTDLAVSKTTLQQMMKDKVLQVRVDGGYGRAYLASEHAPPAPPAYSVNGLDYKAYTGTWPWVPETEYLTPVTSGTATNLDLSKRTQNDDVLLEFTGYISLPTDGTYTFRMITDSTVTDNSSGGMLWIHDAHIIDDDFNHDGSSQSGTMRLKAGLHPIRVLYKHTNGSHDINLKYSGPGITLQDVPNAVLFRSEVHPPEPIANPDNASTEGTNQLSIAVLDNDTDDGTPSPLSIQSVTMPTFGTAVISGDDILYTANVGQFGVDQFNYTITDGQFTAQATVTVDVMEPNTAPTFLTNPINGSGAYVGVAYDGTIAGSASDDDGDTLTYAKLNGPAWLSVAANGDLSGTPTGSHEGANVFTVSASDGIATPAEATLNITVVDNAAPNPDPMTWEFIPAAVVSSGAIVLASTDFTGRTVSGATASNISWTTNGVADPGDLTTDAPDGLFDTVSAQGHFVPDRNVDTEGPWSVSVPISLTVTSLSLTDVVIDYRHFDNSGGFQGASRSVDWTFTLTGSVSGQLDSVTVPGVSGQSGTETATFAVPVNLTDSESYTLLITATGGGPGNNTGLASLTINSALPGETSETEIVMTATTASDASGVEYYFTETSGNPGGSDSGWQDSPVYTDTGLQAGTEYTYTVMARDKSSNQNTTAPSSPESATTGGVPPGNTFSAWISGYDVGGLTGFDDDYDKDGLSNGIENYFGTDPSNFNPGLKTESVATGGNQVLTFSHPLSESPATDISTSYVWSVDLQNFYNDGQASPEGSTVTFSQGAILEGIVPVTATVSGAAVDRVFVRIVVTQSGP